MDSVTVRLRDWEWKAEIKELNDSSMIIKSAPLPRVGSKPILIYHLSGKKILRKSSVTEHYRNGFIVSLGELVET